MKITLKRKINRKKLLRKSLRIRRTKRTQTGGTYPGYYAFFCNKSYAESIDRTYAYKKRTICESPDVNRTLSYNTLQNILSSRAYRYKIFGPINEAFDNESTEQGKNLHLVINHSNPRTNVPKPIPIGDSKIPKITVSSSNSIDTEDNIKNITTFCNTIIAYFYNDSDYYKLGIDYCIIIKRNITPEFLNKDKETNILLACVSLPRRPLTEEEEEAAWKDQQ